MQNPVLQVVVTIDPPPAEIRAELFNTLCEGELEAFERWQAARMEARGLTPSPLIGMERGTLVAYLYFVATRKT
jgi:uncharacterized protein (UPF0218 family)